MNRKILIISLLKIILKKMNLILLCVKVMANVYHSVIVVI
jgi:hypothetical protein